MAGTTINAGSVNGTGIFGSLISGAFGIGMTALNRQYAEELSARDRLENYQYGEKAAENAYQRQRAYTEEYMTPEAQMKHLQNAGLSPSLMYGAGGGTQGATAPQGTGASGIQTPAVGFDPNTLLTMAQVAQTQAQTQKIKAETQTEQGENERGLAEIQKIYAEAGAQDAAKEVSIVQKRQIQLNNTITEATVPAQIKYATKQAEQMEYAAVQAIWEAKQKQIDFEFDRDTFKTRVDQQIENLKNTIKDTASKDSQIKLNEQQILQLQNAIELAWKNYDLQAWQTQINEAKTQSEIYNVFKGLNLEEELTKAGFDVKEKGFWIDFAKGAMQAVITAGMLFLTKGMSPTIGAKPLPKIGYQ